MFYLRRQLLAELKVDVNKLLNKFKNFESVEGRGKIHNIKRYNKKFNLIDESYNANPLSTKNAINKLWQIKKEKIQEIF